MKKTIVIGVTGGIAAFKTCQLVSNLKKKNYDIHVIMTKNAIEFVTPLTFETLSGNKVCTETFDRNFEYDVQHISLAKRADCFVIVPATANFIAKIVHGIADDMLTTTFLAASCKKIICPAMNTGMLNNPITSKNIQTCIDYGYHIVDSEYGFLACGDKGKGKLADIETIEDIIESSLCQKILLNKSILITAGPTQEDIDPVRFITNHSSGKMGYALATAARNLGAQVTLITGPTHLKKIVGIQTIPVSSAKEMFASVKEHAIHADCIIKTAAVADYTILNPSPQKIKKQGSSLELSLERTDDILSYLGQHKSNNQILCGFAMETENLIENAQKKCIEKKCDLLIANSIVDEHSGFNADTNQVTIIRQTGTKKLDLMTKQELAYIILNECFKGDQHVTND